MISPPAARRPPGRSTAPGRCRRSGGWWSRRPAGRPRRWLQVVRGDADPGVGDGERDDGRAARARRAVQADPQHDPAVLGELDRVGQQVAQNLPQPLPVGEQSAGAPGTRSIAKSRPFSAVSGWKVALDVFQQRAQREPLGVNVHPARLDLGQVEDVVDELEQVRACRVDDVGVLDLLVRQVRLGFWASSRARISRLLSGVRSSWDMLARNCDLYLEASASCCARSSSSCRACSISAFLVSMSRFCAGEQCRLVLQLGVGALQLLLPGLQLPRPRLQLAGQPLRLARAARRCGSWR